VVFVNLLHTVNAAVVRVKTADKGGKKLVDVVSFSGTRLSKYVILIMQFGF
jgi:Holliday junction resolvase